MFAGSLALTPAYFDYWVTLAKQDAVVHVGMCGIEPTYAPAEMHFGLAILCDINLTYLMACYTTPYHRWTARLETNVLAPRLVETSATRP